MTPPRTPPKLFLPGPTEVDPEILAEMARPVVGHRTEECARLWKACRQGVGQVMGSTGEILLVSGPASAVMEAALRNCVQKKSLHLVCGAFSKRWHTIAVECGLDADALEVEWGRGFRPEQLDEALSRAPYEAVTIVHNETSTGVTNPLPELAAVMKDHPGTLLLVDTVSSLGGLPVRVDSWGLDVCLAGVQKALALPPGFTVASVSPRAMEKAHGVPHRGWWLDFVRLAESNTREESPATPSTAHLHALARQLERILAEGLETRWERHRRMAGRVRSWALSKGWGILAEEGFRSDTVTCVARGGGPDFGPALERLKKEGFLVSPGYGKLRGATFRFGHMGDHTLEGVDEVLRHFDAALEAAGVRS